MDINGKYYNFMADNCLQDPSKNNILLKFLVSFNC